MKLWIDDVRPSPKGWLHAKSVNEAKEIIVDRFLHIDEISLDHDAGEYETDGGDYIKLLDWLEVMQNTYNFDISHIIFKVHSMNSVGKENMLRIIRKNGWKES